MERDEHEFFLNHVILPRYLPAEKPGYVKQLKLMNAVIQTILDTPHMPQETIKLFKQFKELHDTTAEDFKRVLKRQIGTLLPGETFAIFVRRQNCTLMVQKLQNNSVILATFRGDMRNSAVYSQDSDIEVSFDGKIN